MYKIAKSNLPALFRAIAETKELYLPIRRAGQVNFGPWSEDAEVDVETLKTVKSPKDVFFPQSENLYSCEREGKDIKIEPQALQDQEFVVFGMKACDIKGVEVLDKVFLADPIDTFYAARRDHGIIVAMACHEPEESCFCKVFGVDCADPEKSAADVAVWMLGEKLPYSNLSLEGWGGDKLEEKFNSPKWEELYKPCLACGTCTFVCPTCQCYDIKDYDTGHGVQRYRCWDSCMYSDFTMMAHGNNRTSQMQRFRQRFMHKLVYFPANNDGMYSCVGCGRCVEKCPSSLNIVKVIKSMGGEQ